MGETYQLVDSVGLVLADVGWAAPLATDVGARACLPALTLRGNPGVQCAYASCKPQSKYFNVLLKRKQCFPGAGTACRVLADQGACPGDADVLAISRAKLALMGVFVL